MTPSLSFTCPHCFTAVPGVAGTTVECPKCNSSFAAEHADAGTSDELTLSPLEPIATVSNIPVVEPAQVLSETMELEVEQTRPDQPCGKCERMIGPDDIQCPYCGYNKQIGRKLDAAEFDPYHGVFGFDRYLMAHTQDQNPGGLMLWFHVFTSFCVLVGMLVIRSWTLVVGPTLIVTYVIYRIYASKTYAFQHGKGVLPKFLLLYNRLNGWKGFTDHGSDAGTIVSQRSQSFTDNTLAAIEQVEELEVLDIADSAITDDGVRYLVNFPNLRSLVVSNCELTAEALNELQHALPAVCIWRP